MQITRTRELTVRMGEYESFKFGATVVRDFPDDADPDVVNTSMNEYLDTLLADDITDAGSLSGDRKSFIHKITAQ